MPGSGRPAIFVHLLPGLIPPGALDGGVAIVVDVLRATTVMVQALAAGAEAVLPCAEIAEALAVRDRLPAGSALLGGERAGLPIEGFDLGNSPADYTEAACQGKTVVMTTTNGTRSILASLAAERVLVAAFPNLSATVAAVSGESRPIHVVCSGTDGLISWEDSLLAGALTENLNRIWFQSESKSTQFCGNDQALLAAAAYSLLRASDDTAGLDPRLVKFLEAGRGGQRVRKIGLGADIDDAAHVNRFPIVAELKRDPLRIVRL